MHAAPTWTKFSEATKADLDAIEAEESHSSGLIPLRMIEYLRSIEDVKMDTMPLGAIDHCRQTATRALRDGRDEEYVVCALLHDIGEAIATFNHGDFAAALLKPYVSAENHWMVKHHPLFQGHYFFEHLGLDPTPATATGTTPATGGPWSSARATTRSPSIPPTTRCRSTSSRRWSNGCSPGPARWTKEWDPSRCRRRWRAEGRAGERARRCRSKSESASPTTAT